MNPAKTAIVKSGQTSDLHVLYRARELASDVTALQVELWNAGREAIHAEQLLSPILLETSPSVPILEARIRRVSRSVTNVQLDSRELDRGRLGISWKILEHDDAAILQLILAGPPETTVKAIGTIEGQAGIKTVEPFDEPSISNLPVIIAMILLFGVIFVPPMLSLKTKIYASQIRYKEAAFLTGTVLLGIFILVLIAWLVGPFLPGPPSTPLPFQ